MIAHRPHRLYSAYIFDLDGTVCLGETLLPTVEQTIGRLRACRRRTVFLSNNSTKTCAGYARQLTGWGIVTQPHDVINSTVVLIDFLRTQAPRATRLFVIGEEPLKADLQTAGFELHERAESIDAVIASFDRTFTYAKLQIAFDAIRAGARFFATNGDRYRPTIDGGQPDAAAVIAAIEACTSTKCEAIVGKPSSYTIRSILDLVNVPPQDCIVIGDRLETDVRMALDAGMSAALVLTGATTWEMVERSSIRPTYVVERMEGLLPPPRLGGLDHASSSGKSGGRGGG